MKRIIFIFLILLPLFIFTGCSKKWTEENKGNFSIIHIKNGSSLGYSPSSGIKILTVNRLPFKDLNKNGKLDVYEDWRQTVEKRAQDLAAKMSVEQIAGLMLYSSHQSIPAAEGGMMGATYNGQPFSLSGSKPSDLTDQQKKFLAEDNVRHILVTRVESPEVAALWNNNVQAFVEALGFGIPVNNSSDPRHGTEATAEYNLGAGGNISMWPNSLGIAATFDPEVMLQFGKIASTEYRALGITTALSPQIDLATEPRWGRFNGTMGEDPDLATDMARAYVDGFQSSEVEYEITEGWGYRSVNAMVKHWPGGGPEEGGRDAHFGYGAYAVYPGNNLKDHLKPFTEGAFKLNGLTRMASAVMPYYTISYNIDTIYHENVGNCYSKFIITNLLREKYNYDGVVCTDWGVTGDVEGVYQFQGKPWGVEKLTVTERHYKAIMAGVDQFGGNNDKEPVIEAYSIGVKEYGEEFMRKRFEELAVRLLKNIFRVGLFENPYLDPEETKKIVGNPDFMKAGYEAQLKSIVMLKNKNNILPLKEKAKVYIPKRKVIGGTSFFSNETRERIIDPLNPAIASRYFSLTDNPAEADAAIVVIDSPAGGSGFNPEDLKQGGTGYVPITLQYEKYTAVYAREKSIAGGSPFESSTNRSYRGKSTTAVNSGDLKLVMETRKAVGNKPLILVVNTSNPFVLAEMEKVCNAILLHFAVQNQALLDIIAGKAEPSAILPFQMPADMKTVEEQLEDVPRDMKCYTDSEGDVYDFGFGMNWKGVINDERVARYK
ncbi:MAG TPA: glycoside hydrolase family 3 N-terminal domain-containing protein [Bacteroidales bacterium]|nr:glycoside hydrolase family 3 N-terminal domain-containing protein [Bacteroidales bacterium]HQG37237.1 glycoside hydrolase family 3 N-terminal domain-containing protein [Bacteroidales bacterium]HQG53764.1 glycoside hydrolase family 3 N-terminal domain-containing protein [Bacteroidales bacterium]HQJ21501.1 glycoside hydrolase family 3 N-terminal domain-containing protein [Bacteroidales bacterium]